MASSRQIGDEHEVRLERLLQRWGVAYHRKRKFSTTHGRDIEIDFWLPRTETRVPIVIECKTFGVAAKVLSDSRRRKTQEALWLLVQVRRHCPGTAGSRVIIVTGKERFTDAQLRLLAAELQPDFHVASIEEPNKIHELLDLEPRARRNPDEASPTASAFSQIKAEWLSRSYRAYYDDWLDDKWAYVDGWLTHFPELVLWYSVAGSARGSEAAADGYVESARAGRIQDLPERPRRTLDEARRLSTEVCGERRTNPVDWFTGGCGSLESGWRRLDDIYGIGPKIASFILRDLSFMRDHSDGTGGPDVVYRDSRSPQWFDRLAPPEQALFVPIDVYVHEAARRHGASRTCAENDVSDIQWTPELHREAAAEIVTWARSQHFDPRDLDVYWYSLGAENVREDGTPTY